MNIYTDVYLCWLPTTSTSVADPSRYFNILIFILIAAQQFQHSENLDFGDAESSQEKRRCTNTRQPVKTSFPLLLGDADGDDVSDGMANEHKGSSQEKQQESSGQDSSYEPSDTERLNASFELFDNDDEAKLEEEKNVMTSFAPTKDGSYGEYAFYVSDEDEGGTSASQGIDIWTQIDSVEMLKAERQCPAKSQKLENGFIVGKFTPASEMCGGKGSLNSVGETNAQAEMGDDTKAVVVESSVAGDTDMCVASETTEDIASDTERVAAAESGERPGNGEDVKTCESAPDETNTENTQRAVTDMDADDSMTVETNTATPDTGGRLTDTNTDDLTTGEMNVALENTHEKLADMTAVDSATDKVNTAAANVCVEVTDTIVVDSSHSTREYRTPEIDRNKLKIMTTTTEAMLSSTEESKTNASSIAHAQKEAVILGEAKDSAIPGIQRNENVIAAVGMENVSKVDKLDAQCVRSDMNTDKDRLSERTEGLSDKTGECDTGGTIEENKTSDDAKSLKNGAAPGKADESETDDDILNMSTSSPDRKQVNPVKKADMSETEDDILNVSASSPSQKYIDPATEKADISKTEDDVLLASPPSQTQVNPTTKKADMSDTEDDILNVSASSPSQKYIDPATEKADISKTGDVADILNVSASPSERQVKSAKKADVSEVNDVADVLNVSTSPPTQRRVNPAIKETDMSETEDDLLLASPPSKKQVNPTAKEADMSETEDVADILNVSAYSPSQKYVDPATEKADLSKTEDDVLLASPPLRTQVNPATKKADMSKIEHVADILNVSASPTSERQANPAKKTDLSEVKDIADVLNVSASPPTQKHVNPTKSKREDSSVRRAENVERANHCGNTATSRVDGGDGVTSSTDVIVIDDDDIAVATSNRDGATWPHDTVDITCETTDTDATVDPRSFPTACCSGVGSKRTGPVLAVSGLMMDDTTTSTSDSYSSHGGGKRRRRRRWRKDRHSNTHPVDLSQFHRHGGGGDNPGVSRSKISGGTIDLTSDDDAMAAGDAGRVHTSGVAAFDGYCADNESGPSDSDASTIGEWGDRDSPLFTTKRGRRVSSDMDVIVVDDDTSDDCAGESGNVASEHDDMRTVGDKPSAAPNEHR